MKTVYLIRHAKSSWDDPRLQDVARPLNERGLRDAPFMAKMLRAKGAQVDQILSSPANRAFATAAFFAEAFGIAEKDIHVLHRIYEAFPETIVKLIQGLEPTQNTVFLFGHNPTLTAVANLFTHKHIDNIPTCGIVRIDAAIDDWGAFLYPAATMTEFHYPKQYFD